MKQVLDIPQEGTFVLMWEFNNSDENKIFAKTFRVHSEDKFLTYDEANGAWVSNKLSDYPMYSTTEYSIYVPE